MMLIGDRNGAITGWKNPYATNGLVAMFDGEWNVGGGIHDEHANSWVDLSNNGNTAVAIGSPTWAKNAFDGSTASGSVGPYFESESDMLGKTISTGIYTVEIVVTSEGFQQSNGGILGIGGKNRQFWIWESNDIRTYFIDAIQSAQGNWNRPNDNDRNKTYLYQFIMDGSFGRFYINGLLEQSRYYTTSQTETDLFQIGRIYSYSTTHSKIHCIRIYSRALTDYEVVLHREIDKSRFGST